MDVIKYFKDETGVCAFSTYAGFNVCDYAGADKESVEVCRQKLLDFAGVRDLYVPRQTHSVRVARPGESLDGVDALVTDRPDQLLCINTADCLPLLLYDPVAKIIGAAHCGWRGTVGGIAAATMREMERLGARESRTLAAVGPYICRECFEVGPEVACQFPDIAIVRNPGKKPHVDLLAAVKTQIPGVSFVDNAGCSMTDLRYYSVRRQGRQLPFRTVSSICLMNK